MYKEIQPKIEEKIEALKKMDHLISSYFDSDETCPGRVIFDYTRLIIRVNSLEGLREARGYLRRHIGSWEDKVEMTWMSGNELIRSYTSSDHPIELWLSFNKDELPEGFLKDTCKIVETPQSSYDIICEVKK